MDTFNDSLDMADVLDAPTVSAQQFAAALFNAYENKDLSAFLMAICQHSMFDLLRNAADPVQIQRRWSAEPGDPDG